MTRNPLITDCSCADQKKHRLWGQVSIHTIHTIHKIHTYIHTYRHLKTFEEFKLDLQDSFSEWEDHGTRLESEGERKVWMNVLFFVVQDWQFSWRWFSNEYYCPFGTLITDFEILYCLSNISKHEFKSATWDWKQHFSFLYHTLTKNLEYYTWVEVTVPTKGNNNSPLIWAKAVSLCRKLSSWLIRRTTDYEQLHASVSHTEKEPLPSSGAKELKGLFLHS